MLILLITYIIFSNYVSFNVFIICYLLLFYLLFLNSIFIQYNSINSYFNYIVTFDILQSINNIYYYPIIFEFDSISCVFSSTTIQIAFFSNIFSYYYMLDDLKNKKFFFLLNFFIFSMVFLLHSKSYILLFFF